MCSGEGSICTEVTQIQTFIGVFTQKHERGTYVLTEESKCNLHKESCCISLGSL